MYRAVVWQHVLFMVCVLCGGVVACNIYVVYCVVVWQHAICMACVLCSQRSAQYTGLYRTSVSVQEWSFIGVCMLHCSAVVILVFKTTHLCISW